jgi:hypothetical protein
MIPLRCEEHLKEIVSPELFKVLFSEWEVILGYNSIFLEKIESKIADWNPLATKVGDAFLMIVTTDEEEKNFLFSLPQLLSLIFFFFLLRRTF